MSRQEDGGLAHLKKILERKAASLDVPGAQGKETFEEYLIRNREYLLDSANDEVLWDLGQGVNVSPQVLQKWLEDLDKPQGPDPQAGIIALVKALNLPVRQYGIEVSGTIWECLGDLVFDGQGLADIAPLAEKLGAPVETCYLAGCDFLQRDGLEIPKLGAEDNEKALAFARSELGERFTKQIIKVDPHQDIG